MAYFISDENIVSINSSVRYGEPVVCTSHDLRSGVKITAIYTETQLVAMLNLIRAEPAMEDKNTATDGTIKMGLPAA